MNGPFVRSALLRAAEAGLDRQARRQRQKRDAAIVLTICATVIGVFLLAQFIQQVLP